MIVTFKRYDAARTLQDQVDSICRLLDTHCLPDSITKLNKHPTEKEFCITIIIEEINLSEDTSNA